MKFFYIFVKHIILLSIRVFWFILLSVLLTAMGIFIYISFYDSNLLHNINIFLLSLFLLSDGIIFKF